MSNSLLIGVLGIQGAVSEHISMVTQLGHAGKLVKYPKDFDDLDGLILPGGESTTMAIVCEECGLFPALRQWVHSKRPTYGTCAGMILLSDHAIKTADGGQSLVGGLDVHVCRNFFGSQIYSTTVEVKPSSCAAALVGVEDKQTFPAVFIRAPAILKVGPQVEVLATISALPHRNARRDVLQLLGQDPEEEQAGGIRRCENPSEQFDVIIAVRQGHILATAFHPELTKDLRWHAAFLKICQQQQLASIETKVSEGRAAE